MGDASRVYLKRKAVKSLSGPRKKKVAKVSTGPRKPRRQRKLLVDATEEEKEKVELEEKLKKIAALEQKEKEKETKLENSYNCGDSVDERALDKMYSKLPTRDDPQTVAN
jgi:hypothetical protein